MPVSTAMPHIVRREQNVIGLLIRPRLGTHTGRSGVQNPQRGKKLILISSTLLN